MAFTALILLRVTQAGVKYFIILSKFYDFLECYLKLGHNHYESTPLYGIHYLSVSLSLSSHISTAKCVNIINIIRLKYDIYIYINFA